MNGYRVRFWNPAFPGKGFIEGYKTAAAAKRLVEKFTALYERDGSGIKAEYLGKPKPKDKAAA